MNTRTSCSYFLIVGTSWPEQHLNAQYDSSSSLLRCWLSNWARTLDYEYANFISELSKSCIDSDSSFHSIKCLVDEVFAERTGGTQVKLSKRFHPMTKDEFGVMSAECCYSGWTILVWVHILRCGVRFHVVPIHVVSRSLKAGDSQALIAHHRIRFREIASAVENSTSLLVGDSPATVVVEAQSSQPPVATRNELRSN